MEWTRPFYGLTHCPAKSKLSDKRVSVSDRGLFAILKKKPAGCCLINQSELDKAEKGEFKEGSIGWIEEIYDTVEKAKEEGEKWLNGK